MAAFGYVRVSTDRQATEGESLDVQMRQIEGYAAMQGWHLAEVFREEGVSGSVPLGDRQEGERMLSLLSHGDVLVVAKLDRLFRSALDALRVVELLRERGVALHMIDLGGDVSGNGLSRMFLTVAAAFAEAERDRIRERVVQTKRDQAARGRYLGGVIPFGFTVDDDGALVEQAWRQPARAMMVRLHRRGRSLRKMAVEVSEKFAVPVSHMTVKAILQEEGWR